MASDPRYVEQGYLIPLDILTADETTYYRDAFDRLERRVGKDKSAIGLIQTHLEERDVWDLATHPRVLDAAEAALGPDIVLVATHFFVKYPDMGERFVAWHQDVTYWGFDPPVAATVWLAIDNADVENGCMRVIPGSHRQGQLPHGKSTRPGNLLSVNQEVPIELVNENAAVDFPLRAGQASLHDGLLVHGSNPNHSKRRRCGLTIRFTRPDVSLRHDPNLRAGWKPMLMRGADRFRVQNMLPAIPPARAI